MNISAPFIKRPVGTSLLTAAVLLLGAIAYPLLPISSLPQVDFPVIQVSAGLPGASPETMASAVTTPLERQLGRIAGITEMTSTSTLGATSITLQFALDRDIDGAGRDVQAAINAAAGQLPAGLPTRPFYRKTNPADGSAQVLALTSDTLPLSRLYDIADSIAVPKLSQIQGVGVVNLGGSSKPAVRIEMNPTLLAHYGISLEDVRTALGQMNANLPNGSASNGLVQWLISDENQLFDAQLYRPIVIAYRHGAPVRLGDVATVHNSVENIYTDAQQDAKHVILLLISRQPGANIVSTVERIRASVPQLRASIPPSAQIITGTDQIVTIRESVKDMQETLLTTIALVVLVIFGFLRNVRATVIPAVAVPVSLVGTFGVMHLLGYSLDNLSLMALTISAGFVVDDAIVVIENITRYRESGLTPLQAAFRGSREIGFTVLTISVSLIAVFVPVLLMGGIVGRLFREFAVTLSAAIVVSLAVSLTTTPMMCAKFLKASTKEPSWIYRLSDHAFEKLVAGYGCGLRWILRHQRLTLTVILLTVCLNVYLYVVIPKGFFPQQDTGLLTGTIQADQDISFQTMLEKENRYDEIVKADPAVSTFMSSVGGARTINVGSMLIGLKPLSERKISADDVIRRLRPKLATVPGATLFLQVRQDLRVGGRVSSSQYQFTLESEDLAALDEWAPRMLAKMRTLPQLSDVASDQQNKGLLMQLTVDRDTASRLGISTQMIDNTLNDAFGQRQISTLYTSLEQYHVVMEVSPGFQQNPDALQNIYVGSANGSSVPLSAFAHSERRTTSLQVNHQAQFPAITLSFNLVPGVALGDAVDAINAAVRQLGMPTVIRAGFQGTAEAFQDSLSHEGILILSALATIYIVLGMLYESYIHPITILSTLPSAGVGALLALVICKTDLSVIALIGILLLIGLVKKNAILMIDFALDAERKEKKSPEEAIYQASLLRFRPIMMTTMAAFWGAVPLALGSGVGSELRRPLGISIVGGLIVSQILTLFTTPVVYLYMDRLRFSRVQSDEKLAPLSRTPVSDLHPSPLPDSRLE